jgi:hypothetical protein
VSSPKLTDAGLKQLEGMMKLHTLNLSGSKFTNAGLAAVCEIKSLQVLEFSFSQVTDAGLKPLVGLKNLEALNLTGCKLTNGALKELRQLKTLQSLWTSQTEITAAGAADIQSALPKCRVIN